MPEAPVALCACRGGPSHKLSSGRPDDFLRTSVLCALIKPPLCASVPCALIEPHGLCHHDACRRSMGAFHVFCRRDTDVKPQLVEPPPAIMAASPSKGLATHAIILALVGGAAALVRMSAPPPPSLLQLALACTRYYALAVCADVGYMLPAGLHRGGRYPVCMRRASQRSSASVAWLQQLIIPSANCCAARRSSSGEPFFRRWRRLTEPRKPQRVAWLQ